MAPVEENLVLAQKISNLLKGQASMKIIHNEHGTFVDINSEFFSFDRDAQGKGFIIYY
jgi:hypothetical protein